MFDLVMLHHEIAKNNLVIFCWIPSHIGKAGNERVDMAAEEALRLVPSYRSAYNSCGLSNKHY